MTCFSFQVERFNVINLPLRNWWGSFKEWGHIGNSMLIFVAVKLISQQWE